jgi:hypothetical protein
MGRPRKQHPVPEDLPEDEEERLRGLVRLHRVFLEAVCDTPPGKRRAVISSVDPSLLDLLAYLFHLVLTGVISICSEDIAYLRDHRAEKRVRDLLESEDGYKRFLALDCDTKVTTLMKLGFAPNVLLRPLFDEYPKREKPGQKE